MNKKIKIIALISLCLIVLAWVFVGPRQEAQSTADGELLSTVVQKGNLEVSIHTVGVLDSEKSHMVSSAIRGNKGKIISLVRDGSWVDKGDVLVRLDPSPFEKEVHRLQGKVESLDAAVQASEQMVSLEKNQISQNIAGREYDLKVARLDLERLIKGDGPLQLAQYAEEMGKAKAEYERYASFYKELLKLENEGFNNPAELERAKENARTYGEKLKASEHRLASYRDYVLPSTEESAKAKVENSILILAQSKKAAVYKIANVIADLNQMKAKLATAAESLALARVELGNTEIKAPFQGIAILSEAFRDGQKRKPREGDTVLMNQSILYLPDISNLIVRTTVREVDLHKVELGQKASVLIDAYPSLRFQAEVQFVGALATGNTRGSRSGKYFQVILAVSGKDIRLRPGMTARVLIQAEAIKNVLLIPVQAVFHDHKGKPFCYRQPTFGTSSEKVLLTLGRENEMQVEVVAGLQQGDRLSLVSPH